MRLDIRFFRQANEIRLAGYFRETVLPPICLGLFDAFGRGRDEVPVPIPGFSEEKLLPVAGSVLSWWLFMVFYPSPGFGGIGLRVGREACEMRCGLP